MLAKPESEQGDLDTITWRNERRKLADLIPWEHNPREINELEAARLGESLDVFGQIQPIAVDPNNEILDGHQRQRVWAALERYGPDYEVDVRVAHRPLTEKERQKLVIYLHKGTVGNWDWDMLANVFEAPELVEWGMSEESLGLVSAPDVLNRQNVLDGVDAAIKKPQALTSVDLIYSASSPGLLVHCCMAARMGWMYGFQSGHGPCSGVKGLKRHWPAFIDNTFKAYDHAVHLAAVSEYQPKYATVCDVMSRAQCEELGTTYYDLDQILVWAEELAGYAQNVIVIPKWDCIKHIPENFMLGYSVPSSYGGSPLPITLFAGRRTHLLGGSPSRQIATWQLLPEDVVSLDNNYIFKIAQYGLAWCPDGQHRSLTDLGFTQVRAPLFIALSISLGNMGGFFLREPIPADDLVAEVAEERPNE